MAVRRRSQGSFQRGFDVCTRAPGCLDLQVGFLEFAREALHLSRQQVLRNSAGVVGVQELLTRGFGLVLAFGGSAETAAGFRSLAGQLVPDRGLDLRGVGRMELETTVEVDHSVFDKIDAH
ncbi:hypothetical protein [Amycolatopsis sp.]|uniref:hypothetical protein n=1 Tax=Amycolatopsis sp. TaxID=37632 RepID=UPI002C5DF664|nr:hypothetical protein [Amycolatopsis sp.]HVV12451.1 hypothetical protein [Amycolatopsis sp.]